MESANEFAPIDMGSLILQLDNFKLMTELNNHLLDRLTREQLLTKFMRAESYLADVEVWKKQGDPNKYNQAITDTIIIVSDIRTLLIDLFKQ